MYALKYARSQKVNFLGFDIKISSKYDFNVLKTRRILSFKKLRSRLFNQKKNLSIRYSDYILRKFKVLKKQQMIKILGKVLSKKEFFYVSLQLETLDIFSFIRYKLNELETFFKYNMKLNPIIKDEVNRIFSKLLFDMSVVTFDKLQDN